MLNRENEILGVIQALPTRIIDRILSEGKSIFIKYPAFRATKKLKFGLKNGMKLWLYQSGGTKNVVGEATIKDINFLTYQDILRKYKQKIMLTEEEFKLYCNGREEKPAIILILNDIKRYKEPKKITTNITMAGLYVTHQNRVKLGLGGIF